MSAKEAQSDATERADAPSGEHSQTESPPLRRKTRRWILLMAILVLPLLAVAAAWPRMAVVNWVMEHGRIALQSPDARRYMEMGPEREWLEDRLRSLYLVAYGNIMSITLNDVDIGSGRMRALAALPELENLALDGVTINSRPLLPTDGFRSLDSLELRHVSMSSETLVRVGQLPRLTRLKLMNVDLESAKPLSVAPFRSLETLTIGECRLSRKGLKNVGGVTPLQLLRLKDVELASAAPFATGFQRIEEIWLHFRGTLSRKDLGHIAKIPGLKSLSLSASDRAEVRRGALKGLVPMKDRLKELRLTDCSVDDDDIRVLSKMSSLDTLAISHDTQITGDRLMKIGRLPNLTQLKLRDLRHVDVFEMGRRFEQANPGVQVN